MSKTLDVSRISETPELNGINSDRGEKSDQIFQMSPYNRNKKIMNPRHHNRSKTITEIDPILKKNDDKNNNKNLKVRLEIDTKNNVEESNDYVD